MASAQASVGHEWARHRTADCEREILDAVRGIRYGSVEVVDARFAKVVQVVRTEKVRFEID